MNKEHLVTLSAMIIYLTASALNFTVAASQPLGGLEAHFCGVIDGQTNNQFVDQNPIRRYRTFTANLDVGEPRTVRMIYFTRSDHPYNADVVQLMKDEILAIQTFFAEQMDAHGYGKLTFRVETDAKGEPIVHHVAGEHPRQIFLDAIKPRFDLNANIYLIVSDDSALVVGGSSHRKGQGTAMVNERFSSRTPGRNIATHELGHAFGLDHDFRDGAYIMSYGNRASIGPRYSQLSACHAEILAVHPYFNPEIPIEEGRSPNIELISPLTYPVGSQSVPIQLRVSDSEGLHQVRLGLVVIACRGLEGKKDALVEFNYDGYYGHYDFISLSDSVTHRLKVEAIDTDGNSSKMHFQLAEASPHHIATLEHTGRELNINVTSLAFSIDGMTLAVGLWDGTVKLWDVTTYRDIATLKAHSLLGAERDVYSVAFSPVDATLLATGAGDGTVKLWNVATHQEVVTFERQTDEVNSLAFSIDGMALAVGLSDGTIELWDVSTHRNIAILEGHTDNVRSLAFSIDGFTLASGSLDGTVKLWDVATHRDIATLKVPSTYNRYVLSVAFSPVDATLLATGAGDGTVKLWNVVAHRIVTTLNRTSSIRAAVSSVAFLHDGMTLASTSAPEMVNLWDITTGVTFASIGHTSRVSSVAFSSDGTILASGTWDGTVELWDATGLMEGLAEIYIPDPNLHAVIAEAIGLSSNTSILRGYLQVLTRLEAQEVNITNLTGLEHATNLKSLDLRNNNISDVSALAGLSSLTSLLLPNNIISDISAVEGLTNLKALNLAANSISDISPLIANTGLGEGDTVSVRGNPLSHTSIHTHIPTLQNRGVRVYFDDQAHPALLKISGDNQNGASLVRLPNPLVVEVQDENGSVLEGTPVTFAVTAGGGTLSETNTITDSNGRAESTLTLGPNLETNAVQVSAAGIRGSVIFHAISDTEAPRIISDVNGDGSVNILDLVSVASKLGTQEQNLAADVNGDGVVNILDLVLVAGALGNVAATPSAWYRDLEIAPTRATVEEWLALAQTLDLADATSQRGVLFLKHLLAALTPKETVLLPNFPNPFNPETWMPFQLAEDADVKLTIYDTNGTIIRHMELGHRLAGYYADRGKAAYWDGRNDLGEPVASGVYFYALTAGRYSMARKMLIRM